MKIERRLESLCLGVLLLLVPGLAAAQGTAEDYRRALSLPGRFGGLVVNVADNVEWIGESSEFTFRRSVEGGHRFLRMDAETLEERPAFDHNRLAAALSRLIGEEYTALTLPFESFNYTDGDEVIEFGAGGPRYRCDMSSYDCDEVPASADANRGARRSG